MNNESRYETVYFNFPNETCGGTMNYVAMIIYTILVFVRNIRIIL